MVLNTIALQSEENIRTLNDSEITPYLSRLKLRLSQLSSILKREGDEFITPYFSILINSIECLLLKHALKGQDKIDFSLTIAPIDSGFPTAKDFYLIERNKAEAASFLQALPKRDEIIELIRNAVLRGDSPANSQIILRRYNLYSRLSESEVLKGYHLNEPKFIREENGRRFYTLEWSCIERGSNLPVFYRMYLTQDRRFPRLDEMANSRLNTVIYQTQWGTDLGLTDLRVFALHVDREIEEVHPKLVEKYKIGPYHDILTTNSRQLQRILEETDEPSVLKFSVEKVASERVQEYGNWWDKFRGKKTEREIFGPLDSEVRIIVPFRVKQELGNNDEYGKPCKVYCVTKGGEIVG